MNVKEQNYIKYITLLQNGCNTCIWTLKGLAQNPADKGTIDEKIHAVEVLIRGFSEVKRSLLYFKNTEGNGK